MSHSGVCEKTLLSWEPAIQRQEQLSTPHCVLSKLVFPRVLFSGVVSS